ncbi:DUF6049 family protein [Gardnerella leopoldii]|uniref:DUF6049 family protein n=1 Tax=Gardnerella TaxID=2701 RepID=UPI003971120C
MPKKHIGGLTVKKLTRKHQTTNASTALKQKSLSYVFSLLRITLQTCLISARFIFILFVVFATIFAFPTAKYAGLVNYAYANTKKADLSDKTSTRQNKKQSTYENPHSKGIEIDITQATPVVTDKSGYHLTATLKAVKTALPEGTLQLSINSNYTFVSRTDVQNWSQEESLIPTPQILDSVKTPSLASGHTCTLSFNIPADKQELRSILNWGPKPLKITYFSQNYSKYKSIHSFLTRANIGMHSASLPAMKLTALMPILIRTQNDLRNFKTNNIQPSDHLETLLRADKDSIHNIIGKADLANKHSKLQTIADLSTIQASHLTLKPSAYMQQSGFDISAYADDNNDDLYKSAGITKEKWSAKNSQSQKNITKANNSKQTDSANHNLNKAYAWQTYGKWTIHALEQAKRNGYETVIATDEFDNNASQFAVRNGIYDIDTPAGNVRVLSPQSVLTLLANGKPTSDNATSERTQAGRINRLVAQSAFYQMEQPYVDRHILITFSNNASNSNIDAVMNALEQSPWLSLSDLQTMANTKQNALPDWKKNSIMREISRNSSISANITKTRRSCLNDLSHSRKDVLRFTKNILDYSAAKHPHNTEGDAQALAKQTAKTKKLINIKDLEKYLLRLYDDISLHEFTNNTIEQQNSAKTTAHSKKNNKSCISKNTAKTFANTLMNGIRIIPPHDITAVSETASMPITISNTYSYPVQVYLSANTHAMEIVTRRKTLVKIPANSETQVTLPLRITTSIHTKATFVLEDNQHRVFAKEQSTLITSTLQISDKSGTIIIVFAFILGLLGLWRQFHRKKDPDE